jgi:hypothetical protein
MPVTIKVNGTSNSLVHKGSNGVSMATIPDVCKTPTPGGPVPLPYPNISQSATLAKGTTTVKADGGMMIAIKGSEFSLSNGDNPGVAGGVKSSTFMKESTWILYSFDVKMDGENACRLSDKKFQNHENTVDLAGATQPPTPVPTPAFQAKRATLDNIKKSDKRATSTVGDGTTAAALHNEIATLKPTKNKWHYIKAKELRTRYRKLEDDALKEERAGDITPTESDELRKEAIEGFVRNDDALTAANAVPTPPWPT